MLVTENFSSAELCSPHVASQPKNSNKKNKNMKVKYSPQCEPIFSAGCVPLLRIMFEAVFHKCTSLSFVN